ncbi:MAG: hypothetical protein WD468_11265 [Pirellulales bacterium]
MTQLFGCARNVCLLLTVLAISSTAVRALAEGKERAQASVTVPDPPSPDDDTKYDLRYKLAIGDVLRYEVTHLASIQSTIEQSTQAAQTKTDSVKNWKVTDVLPSGEIEFMNVVERVSMVNQLPDHDPVEYDSDRDKTPPPGFEDAAKAVGVPLSVIRITPQGKITRRDIRLRQLQVDEDAPIVVRLPDQPVAIGATWDEPFDIKVDLQGGATRSIQTRRHHKLTGVTDNIATIEVTYQVLSPIDPPQEAQLVQRMIGGEVQFNIVTGRVIGQRMDIDKRILGFAGPTSSMQYIMRMEEKLLDPTDKIAVRPLATDQSPVVTLPPGAPLPPGTTANARPPVATPATAPVKNSSSKAVASPRRQSRPTRTASRPRPAPQGARGYVR